MRPAALSRGAVIALTALVVFTPIALIVYQSLLNAPFFMPASALGLDAYRFVFDDPDFYQAFRNSVMIAFGMLVISVPLGGALAFLLARTDLPGKRWIELAVLVPVFISPMVLAFGYVVSVGPVGFFTVWLRPLLGEAPWNVYSMTSIALIAGLTHVPHVFLYSSSALRNLGSDVEEAARISGASPLRVALNVSLPMVSPALLYSGVLVFFLGFEIFGLPLVLGDPEGHLHAAVQQRRRHHGQADVQRHAQGAGAADARGFFHVRAQVAQGRGRIQKHMRHMGQPGNQRNAGHRIDIPRRFTQQRAQPDGEKPHRPHRHHIAKGQHHRRDKHRHQHRQLDPALARQIGARQQEGQRAAQRHRNHQHAKGDHHRVAKRLVKIRVVKHKAVGVQPQRRGRHEERRVQQALVDNQRNRGENHQGGERNHRPPREGGRPHLRTVASRHCLRKARRLA
jgi:ABC-type spermidine/putrescine transport system permease subunit II